MKAVILCGGLGERLRPYTETVPKVMLELNGKTLLEHVINHIKSHGIQEFILLCGYKSEMIKNFLGDGKKLGIKVVYSVEKEKLGTAGAVSNARGLIKEDFLLVNGDVITDFPLDKLLAMFYKIRKPIATLVRPRNPFGVAETENVKDGIKIKNFVEKPRMNEWVNAGYTVLTKETIELFPEKGDVETDVYPKLAKKGELYGFLLDDKYKWKSIDTQKDLRAGVA